MKRKNMLIALAILGMISVIIWVFIRGDSDDSTFYFKDIDFSTGGYAVIIQNNGSAFLNSNAAVLSANAETFKIKKSLERFIPKQGLNTTGVYVFKDNQLLKSDVTNRPRTFEVGSLQENAIPAEIMGIDEPIDSYLSQKEEIELDKNNYIISASQEDSQGLEYSFILKSPAIAVSKNDKDFSLDTYGTSLKERLKNTLKMFEGFSIGADTYSNHTVMALKLNQQNLRDSKTGEFLSLPNIVYHEPRMPFSSTKEFYEQLQTHDFSEAFTRVGLSESEILTLIQQRLGLNNGSIDARDVYAEMFPNSFEVEDLKEIRYQLRYFNVIENTGLE